MDRKNPFLVGINSSSTLEALAVGGDCLLLSETALLVEGLRVIGRDVLADDASPPCGFTAHQNLCFPGLGEALLFRCLRPHRLLGSSPGLRMMVLF